MDAHNLEAVVPFVLIHAQAEAPRECCGAIIAQVDGSPLYVACRNIAATAEHFVIEPRDLVRAEETGQVIGFAHSHPYTEPTPTEADLAGIERTGVPWLIVNYPTGSFTLTHPSGYVAPLIGRPFVHGVHDCYALVRDYYATQGIELSDYRRSWGWWEGANGPDLYRDNFEKEGFVEVPRETLREHDLILMQIRAPRENHMAVYLGGGVILHHLIGQLSRREAWQEFYQKRTTTVLRHHAFMKEPPCSK
ncbi:C40 family peptidase [Paraburkholderia sp. MM5477-R1]|uniref:C40 family peptidase n=1 Tax=Paraburkholderia sp. MM5477-R1 TaxID=2991062 RepID=UPI003D1B93D0